MNMIDEVNLPIGRVLESINSKVTKQHQTLEITNIKR